MLRRWPAAVTYVGYGCSILLFGILIWRAGPAHLASVLRSANAARLVAGAALAALGWLLLTFKWQTALRMLDARPPFERLLTLTLTAQLWNLILPGQVGGEVYRGGHLVAERIPLRKVAMAAAMDRGSTVVGTALVGLVGLMLQKHVSANGQIVAALALLILAPLVAYALLCQPDFRGAVLRLIRKMSHAEQSVALDEAVDWLVDRPGRPLRLLGLAVLCQVCIAVYLTIWAGAFGVSLTLLQAAWVLAASALLPYLSPLPGASVAVQQGTATLLLVSMGASVGQAGAISITSLALALIMGFAGVTMDGLLTATQRSDGRRTQWRSKNA